MNHPLMAYSWGNLLSVTIDTFFSSVGVLDSNTPSDFYIKSFTYTDGSAPYVSKILAKSSDFVMYAPT